MTKAREEMVNRMIKRYGFEDKRTIEIARACEMYREGVWGDAIIEEMIKAYEEAKDEDDDKEMDELDEVLYVIGIKADGTKYRAPRA